MSIIQSIRDKAAWIIIGAIALALIAFIVQDAFQNRSMFSDTSTTIGVVNGNKIDAVEFEEKFKRAEEIYRQQGYPMNDMMRNNIRESIWSEYVDDAIMVDRYEELGIAVSDKELRDGILYGVNPPQDLRQQFTDPNTGQYDVNAAYQQIEALRKQKNTPQYKSFFEQYLPALRKNRQKEKYISLIGSSAYVPKWLVEKINADNSQKASVSFVSIPYNTISDSAIKVTDAQIEEYVKENPDEYKQEASRSIQYVMFDAGPTAADSAAVLQQVGALKDEFRTTADIQAFLVRNGSETQYDESFELKSKMRSEFADSITALAEGEVAGPFLENGNYVLAKMVEKRTLPDSVKVRHILIRTEEQSRPTLPDSVAKARIDSIVNAIRGGANFADMVVTYSDDQGSKDNGGEYEFTSAQFAGISKEFAEAIFFGKTGDKKTVKVDNQGYAGYHYIEVLSQKNFEPAYKIARFSRAILPSDETTTRQNGLAAQFAAESRNKQQFDQSIKKYNYTPLVATDIKPLDAMIFGLGSSRELIKWVNEAEPGEVSEPFIVEDKFVVAMLTRVYEEGPMAAEKARPLVESVIRNREKGKQIASKLGKTTTVEAAAQATSQQVMKADSIMFASSFIPNVGQEPKVVGAAFNKANQAKASEPIPGNFGVFVLKTESITAVPNVAASVEQQQVQLIQNQQRALSDPRLITEILKKSTEVKDNRHKFF